MIKCVHLSPLTSSTIQSQRKKSRYGTAASVFPDVKVLLVSQATYSDYAFTSFYLDAVWVAVHVTLGIFSGIPWAEERFIKNEDTRLCRAMAAQ